MPRREKITNRKTPTANFPPPTAHRCEPSDICALLSRFRMTPSYHRDSRSSIRLTVSIYFPIISAARANPSGVRAILSTGFLKPSVVRATLIIVRAKPRR